jgi:predicted kinase
MPYAPLRPCAQPGCPELVKSGFCNKHKHSFGYYPNLRKPLTIEVIMVIGAPASGKSSFVAKNKKEGDIVLDLDVIKSEISGKPLHSAHDKYIFEKALAFRNKTLETLQFTENKGQVLWFVIGAPDKYDRQKWKDLLRPSKVFIMQCSKKDCLSRIEQRKSETEWEQMKAVERWFSNYETMENEIVVNTSNE